MRSAPLRERLATVGAALRAQSVLTERDGWSRAQLEAFQRERLDAIVRHAAARSPVYRQALGGLADGPVDLAALPVAQKGPLMERWDDWVTDRRLRRADVEPHLAALAGDELLGGEYRVMATGGSTGTRGIFVFSRPEWHELVAHFMAVTDFPVEAAATFAWIPGVGWSDHWAFWKVGYPAVMKKRPEP